jgi:hypothetical protein
MPPTMTSLTSAFFGMVTMDTTNGFTLRIALYPLPDAQRQ